MAVDKATIDQLLRQLSDYLFRIEQMNFTLEELETSPDIQDLISRRLQVAVEISIDIAMHLAAGLNLPAKDSAADVFELLRQEKILQAETGEQLKEASRFINLLVHGYAKIDYPRVFRSYREDLEDLRRFAKEVVEFLEKNEGK